MRNLAFAITVILAFTSSVQAQIQYGAFNDPGTSGTLIRDHLGNPISNGDEDIGGNGNGQGSLIEIGYFAGPNAGNIETVFTGTFTVLVSFHSGDSFDTNTTVPDGSFGFGFSALNDAGNPQITKFPGGTNGAQEVVDPGSYPPANNTLLAFRWYDEEGYYNTAVYLNGGSQPDSSWLWKSPGNPAPTGSFIDFTFDIANIRLESGEDPTDGFIASLIPEPGFTSLAFTALGLMAFMRRRKA